MTITKVQLESFIERIENLEREKKATADDISDLYAEAKGCGFDVSVLRTIIKRRKDPEKYEEHEALVESYLETLGFDRTPLGMAAGESKVMQ
jgi:uncharacterized protein (UPF0335 family)